MNSNHYDRLEFGMPLQLLVDQNYFEDNVDDTQPWQVALQALS